ncbi:MAG TPA: hypothetical protein VJT31_12030, partial [Rugosimonospora sp.]|nr:hypothetical protein [Rugosimonospora sp.]
MGRSAMNRLGTAARRHWFFLALLALGVALRVVVMVAYRPISFYIDSLGSYLSSMSTLDPSGQDPIGYDVLLLKPVLWLGSLSTLAAVQHLLGIGMAVLTYAFIVHKGQLRAGRWRAVAALATVPILLDAYQLQIEHLIMSDALFQAMLVGALALLAWPDRPSLWRVAVAGLVLGAATTVRAVGVPVVVAGLVYLLWAARPWSRKVLLSGVLALCFALPVGAYAVRFEQFNGRYGLSNVAGHSLYGRVATFADCTGVALPPYQRVLCPTTPVAQRLGPDYWSHDVASPANKPYYIPPGKTGDQVLQEFSVRIIEHQPLAFARSVLGDALRLFSWQRTDGRDTGQPPIERWRFQTTFQEYPPVVTAQTAAAAGAAYGGGAPHVVTPLATALRWYQLHVGYTPGPVIALCLLLGLAGLVRRSPLRATLLLYLLGAGSVLLMGDVYEFSWRYQLPGYALLPAAGVLGLAALLHRR